MTDYEEDQKSEIEALESIYPDEFTVVEDEPRFSFTVSIKTDDYEEDSDEGAYCLLGFTYVDKYPDEPPLIEVVETQHLSDDHVKELSSYLQQLAEENLGMVMVFTLVSSAQEWLGEKHEDVISKREEAKERKVIEAEEAERKKFEGTRVTVESFLTWKAAFDLEMLALKTKQQKEDLASKKLTGRELFERDHTLNESDIQFLQEGEEDIKVDESLFQDLDDLDIDDTLLDDEDS